MNGEQGTTELCGAPPPYATFGPCDRPAGHVAKYGTWHAHLNRPRSTQLMWSYAEENRAEAAESRVTPGITPFSSRERLDGPGASLDAVLSVNVTWMDAWLDENVSDEYKAQPLAQDWARVCKLFEEGGESIDELIGFTGQNPRKGLYGTRESMLNELADTALTAIYAIQHFTKDVSETLRIVRDKSEYHCVRVATARTQ